MMPFPKKRAETPPPVAPKQTAVAAALQPVKAQFSDQVAEQVARFDAAVVEMCAARDSIKALGLDVSIRWPDIYYSIAQHKSGVEPLPRISISTRLDF